MIVVNYGADIVRTTYDTLAASDISSYLEKNFSVSIKPNLVVARPASDGATTHPEVVEGIILFLRDFGVEDIKIIESSWVGDSTKRAFKVCGYEELSRRFGVKLVDLKTDSATVLKHGDDRIKVCDEALKTDFLIDVPVLKAHCQTRFTCCIKNLKGCIPDSEKRKFHSQGIHKPVAALGALIKVGYCVVDGICGDLSFEEGGTPVVSNRIIAGKNPLLVDSFCARLIGYSPQEIAHLSYGRDYGIGEFFSDGTRLVELNSQNKPARKTESSRVAERYRSLIEEDAACSACYSSLIYALHRLGSGFGHDEKIHIGQGFKGKTCKGFGVGNCAMGFSEFVPGCPPTATDILEALKENT
ncbi:MAG: DUF362 domain-containing protein [Oscillospiraceae bacterium]|nr:DUF362 domain-containing protein [Oscillospiraceae bacterium]